MNKMKERVTSLARLAGRLNARAPYARTLYGLRPKLPALFLMSDETRMSDLKDIVPHLPKNTGIILRHYKWSFDVRLKLAQSLMPVVKAHDLVLLIGADVRLCYQAGAHGVHLPESILKQPHLWSPLLAHKKRLILTASAHDQAALLRAQHYGVDAVFLSPVFETQSHKHAKTLGALRFTKFTRAVNLPVYALGGVRNSSIRQLKESGAAGAGVIGALYED